MVIAKFKSSLQFVSMTALSGDSLESIADIWKQELVKNNCKFCTFVLQKWVTVNTKKVCKICTISWECGQKGTSLCILRVETFVGDMFWQPLITRSWFSWLKSTSPVHHWMKTEAPQQRLRVGSLVVMWVYQCLISRPRSWEWEHSSSFY